MPKDTIRLVIVEDDPFSRNWMALLAARDWRTMGRLYADDARFSDPAVPDLDAGQVRAMWRMLISRGTDLVMLAVALLVNNLAPRRRYPEFWW